MGSAADQLPLQQIFFPLFHVHEILNVGILEGFSRKITYFVTEGAATDPS